MTDQLSSPTSTSLAFRNLTETCRSPATRRVYTMALRFFMDYLHLPYDAYDKLLEKEPKLIQMDICDFITHLRKAGHSPASVSTYLAAIRKFYDMNDIDLHWRKIHSFEGEKEKVAEDRPYTHSEIQTLLEKTTYRNRSIILLMASAGLRVGAIPGLRIKDLEPIDKYSIYKINVYARSIKSHYFSYCTPECRKWIQLYLDHRKRWGERITDDSPLFRIEYNPSRLLSKVTPISNDAIPQFMDILLKHTGLRTQPLEGQQQRRLHVMMTHGMPKFFETNAFKAGMEHMYIRRLMGQKSGLEDAYLKLSEEDLLEGDNKHVGYVGIIDQLTIDPKNRLELENKQLKQEVSRFSKMEHQIEELNRRIGLS
jgi:site-specific recombinase XerD